MIRTIKRNTLKMMGLDHPVVPLIVIFSPQAHFVNTVAQIQGQGLVSFYFMDAFQIIPLHNYFRIYIVLF